ncbi:MAG: polysaccharide biosynthesis tyrosine autokinase [Acetobacteraceae bacterium]|nr:polysaccharide biosynthesis tyrosine autokinase [Acetobacteraceae bacterium]
MSSVVEKPLFLRAPASPDPLGAEAVSPTTLFSAIRRHAVVVLLTVLLIPLCVGLIVWQIPSRYAATASVQVQTRSRDLHDVQAVAYDNSTDPNIVTTEVDVLRSNDLALEVVRALHLDQNPEFVGPPRGLEAMFAWLGSLKNRVTGDRGVAASPEAQAARSLLDQLTIVNKERSNILGITVATHSPSLSVEVANAYADQYLKFRRNLKSADTLQARALLDNQLLELKRKQLAAEQAAETFRAGHGLTVVTAASPGGNAGPTVVGQQLAELNRQLVIASTARAQAEADLKQVQGLVATGQAEKAPQVLASPVVQRLQQLEAELSGQLAGAASNLDKSSPILERQRAQLATIRGRIAGEVNKVVASLETEVRSARSRETALTNQLQALRSQVDNQGNEMVRLRELEVEASAAGAIYQDFLQQYKRMTSGAVLQLPDAELIAAAVAPPHATSPKRTLLVLGSFAVSCVIGALLALSLERHHGGFRSSEEFAAETGAPALVLLPKLPRRARKRFDPSLLPSAYREALTLISARLLSRDASGHGRIVMVTSALPAEGKTWLSLSVAYSLAQTGARTLLIDCDLRRGAVAQALGLQGHGLTNLYHSYFPARATEPVVETVETASPVRPNGGFGVPARRKGLLASARSAGIIQTVSRNFDVLPVFPNKVNPVEFLASPQFRELLEHARVAYDMVVIDTPPVMMTAVGRILSRSVDSVLLAVRWCRTPRPVVANAIAAINDSGGYSLNAVLTMVDTKKYEAGRLGDSAYLYRKYAGYYGTAS